MKRNFANRNGFSVSGRTLLSSVCITTVVCTIPLVGQLACDRVISGAPTGQKLAYWATPYDRDALVAAMPNYRMADLSDYGYCVLLAVQNQNKAGFATTLEVNGIDIERRYVASMTQEIFAITEAVVKQTEAQTGVVSADIPFLKTTMPFVIRLKNFVSEDDHLIQNTNLILAPQNMYENDVLTPTSDTGTQLNAYFIKPGAFVVVTSESAHTVIELDREWQAVDESGDPSTGMSNQSTSTSGTSLASDTDTQGAGTSSGQTGSTGQSSSSSSNTQSSQSSGFSPSYLTEEVQVIQEAGLGYLLGGSPASSTQQTPGQTGKVYVSSEEPYDHSAVKAILPKLVADDLSEYNFALAFIVQNRLDSRFGVTLEVNGQSVERRIVDARTQEYFAITTDMIRETELVTGVSSESIPFLGGKPLPFIVRLRDYVFDDGHIQQNTNCVLAPVNCFESMVLSKDDALDPTTYIHDIQFTSPSMFLLVIRQDHNDIIELDRELKWANEVDDKNETTIIRKCPDKPIFLKQEQTVLTQLGLSYLIGGPLDPQLPPEATPDFVPEIDLQIAGGTTSVGGGLPITLFATVKELYVPIVKVEFYDRNPAGVQTLLGTDTAPPFSLVTSISNAGKHSVWAVVTDQYGRIGYSNAIIIEVN